MKRSIVFLTVLIMCMMFSAAVNNFAYASYTSNYVQGGGGQLAAAGVAINETNFPDATFRNIVKPYDTNKDGKLSESEAKSVTGMQIVSKKIASLKGIEYFTNLLELDCWGNQLTALDLSKNTALTVLSCGENPLTALDISKNTVLTTLHCWDTPLTALDLSNNTVLKELNCSNNKLTALDVSKNTVLTTLECHNNQLTALDLSKNVASNWLNWLTCNTQTPSGLKVTSSGNSSYPYQASFSEIMPSAQTVNVSNVKGLDTKGNNIATTYSGGVAMFKASPAKVTYNYTTAYKSTKMDVIITAAFDPTPPVPDGIPIDAEHFPDENFRKVVKNYDTNNNDYLSEEEAKTVKELNIDEKGITDLKGVEYFTDLTSLYCRENQLTALDVSKNTDLTLLWCSGNQITALDVSKNTALVNLSCHSNQLTALDISKNTALKMLDCSNNQITTLDVSKNIAVWYLHCDYNKLTAFDVSKNTAVTDLRCNGNQLTALDVSKNTALTGLHCEYNQLTALDVSQNTALTYLNCQKNQLITLDLSKNAKLGILNCAGQTASGLKITSSGNSSYPYQADFSEIMTSAQIANVSDVQGLDANSKNIETTYSGGVAMFKASPAKVTYNYTTAYKSTKMDVTITAAFAPTPPVPDGISIDAEHFPDENFRNIVKTYDTNNNDYLSEEEISSVRNIDAKGNFYVKIKNFQGIEYFTALTSLDCSNNGSSSSDSSRPKLDVSKNTALTYLDCSHNYMTEIDLSKNTALTYLDCSDNDFLTLDVSKNTALTYLNCFNCAMYDLYQGLNLSKNTALTYLDCRTNGLKTLDVSKSTALKELYCSYNELTVFDLSKNTALEILHCAGNKITDIDLRKNTALRILNCSGNYSITLLDLSKNTALEELYCDCSLTALDVSKNTALKLMDCGGNQLAALDVSKNTSLKILSCDQNRITSLDTSKNTALTALYCSYNKLVELDLSKNTALETLYCNNNCLITLDLSNNSELAMTRLDCSSQTVYSSDIKGFAITLSDNESYPHKFSFSGFMSPEQIANVSDVQGKNSNGSNITTSYSEGTAQFTFIPSKTVYNYATGYSTKRMDVTIIINGDKPPVIIKSSLPDGLLSEEYSQTLKASGAEPITFSLFSGTLPDGLALKNDGTISGTPTKEGKFSFSVRAQNTAGISYAEYFSITITSITTAPKITAAALPDGTTDTSYSQTLTATGTAPITWTLSAGTLPYGLTLDSNGTISGTPTKAGTYKFTAKAQNSAGYDTKQFTVKITNPSDWTKPAITTAKLNPAAVGREYSFTLEASGNPTPTWSIASGKLPAGLTLDDDGKISGTPTKAGTYKFTAKAQNSAGYVQKQFTLKVLITPSITTESLKSAVAGSSYSASLTASGTTPLTWTIEENLPEGLAFKNGTFSGKPKEKSVFIFTAKVSNSAGEDTKTLSIDIRAVMPVFGTSSLPAGTWGKAYSAKISVKKGTKPITVTMLGNLPEGLEFDANTLTISGTPTETCSAETLTFTAENSEGSTSKNLTLTIKGTAPKINTPSAATAPQGTAYTLQLTATGSTPITWTLSDGTLPDGLTLDDDGTISGTPMKAGTYKFTAKAQNSAGKSTKQITLKIINPSDTAKPAITTATLTPAAVGREYSFTLEASENPTWSITSGKLPAGLTLDDDGTISGTPTKAGTYKFTVRAENSLGYVQKQFTLKVLITPSITTESLKSAVAGSSYAASLTASGTTPLTWTIEENLPEGLAFKNGTFSGKPKEKSVFIFTAKVSNSAGEDTKTLSIDIRAVMPVFATTSLPVGTWNKAYSAKITMKKGTKPITLSMSGNLPEGLEFDSETWTISGTPAETCNNEPLTFTASNMEGSTEKIFTLTVNGVAPKIKTPSITPAVKGNEYSLQLEATGSPVITWSAVNLPEGLSIDSQTGEISGTPQEEGTFTFTVTASNGKSSRKTLTLTVAAIPEITDDIISEGDAEESYKYTLEYTGTSPVTFKLSDGSLPNGLRLTSAGRITGTPKESGEFTFTVTASNSGGSSSREITIIINAAPPRITGTLKTGKTGASYSSGLKINSGSLPVEWSCEGDLPAGLEFDSDTGNISGTPEEAYSGYIVVKAENSGGVHKKKVRLLIREDNNADSSSLPEERTYTAHTEKSSLPEEITADVKPDLTEKITGRIYRAPSSNTAIHVHDGLMIAALLGEISCDVQGMYDVAAEISGDVPVGAKLVYIANSDEPSSDDDIAEFFDDEGNEISIVPESRKIIVSIWIHPERTYNPVIAVKR